MSTAPNADPVPDEQYAHLQTEQAKDLVHVNPTQTSRLIIDAHTHIQSNNVAPYPAVASMAPFVGTVLHLRRSFIENTGIIAGRIWDLVSFKPLRGHLKTPNPDGEHYDRWSVGKGAEIGRKNTDEIAADMVRRIDAIRNEFRAKPPYDKVSGLEWVNVIHPMDMEYCHAFGYFGLKVYNAVWEREEDAKGAVVDPYADKGKASDKEPLMYWYPKHGKWQKKGGEYTLADDQDTALEPSERTKAENEETGKRMEKDGLLGQVFDENAQPIGGVRVRCLACTTNQEETKRYERWLRQVERTERAVCDAKLKLLPTFHYDPRRWQSKGNGIPLSQVGDNGLYLGFKMYTAQGYRPYDINRLPILKGFYSACEDGQIPILNHCTPGGARTYDIEAYLRFEHPMDRAEERAEKEPYVEGGDKCIKRDHRWMDGSTSHREFDDPVRYFEANFVAPQAWEKVLTKHPKLRLCLAHFGGISEETKDWDWHGQVIPMLEKYENLYVDISSSFCSEEFRDLFKKKLVPEHPKIHSKILFGSDWPMTFSWVTEGKDYKEFCDTAKACIESMDKGKELWIKFTQENPYRFYKLDKKIDGIAKAIEGKMASKKISKGTREMPGPIAQQSQTQTDQNKEEIMKRAEFIKKLYSGATS